MRRRMRRRYDRALQMSVSKVELQLNRCLRNGERTVMFYWMQSAGEHPDNNIEKQVDT
jgi:hypothetical protein